LLKLCTEFEYMTPERPQKFKDKGQTMTALMTTDPEIYEEFVASNFTVNKNHLGDMTRVV